MKPEESFIWFPACLKDAWLPFQFKFCGNARSGWRNPLFLWLLYFRWRF